MTPRDAVALLERHRDMWPKWVEWVADHSWGQVLFGAPGEVVLVSLRGDGWGRRARVRPGLSDEENVRRIIDAAEKSYRQRLRQVEKQRQRKPLKRTELKPGKGPERKARLKPVRRDRKAKRFEEDFGGKDHAEWGRMRPCDVDGRPATPGMPNHNHHEPSRGAGGKAADQVTLCPRCHRDVHALGRKSFEEFAGRDLRKLAKRRYQQWLDQGGHELPSGLEQHGETR